MNARKKLDYVTVLSEGFRYGMKNVPSLLGALVLWIVTIWIPYVNVGTTIAICTLPLLLSRGEVFSPLTIFDKKYYRYMGEYFLTFGLMAIGIIGAALFLYIPAIVVSLAWSLAILLLLDKGLNAAEAIRMSNKLTYGNKWTILFVTVTICIASFIVWTIISMFFAMISYRIIIGADSLESMGIASVMVGFISILVLLALIVATMAFFIGCQASIYGTLSKNIEEQH
ncbi:MAG: hypothetical protein LBF85_03000 [Tannerella sp.]|jgi:hypothetical protein|nr:hypothetical protein [Tannerella sp.]